MFHLAWNPKRKPKDAGKDRMGKLRDWGARALHPPARALGAFVAATVLGMVWCFVLGGEGSPLSYAVYAFSAYTLVAAVVAGVPFLRTAWGRLAKTRLVAPFVESEGLRAGASGAFAVVYDVAYAAFVLVNGFRYDSGWAVAVALYYLAVAGIGFAVAFGLQRARKLGEARRRRRELELMRQCGVLLVVMALALSGVMVQMIRDRQAWVYSDIVVIAIATFTFVGLALSLRSAVQIRKAGSASLVATRATSLSRTLVQLFFLETTMIAVFGDDEAFRFQMEAATGAVVQLLVLAAALALIVSATRRLRDLRP